MQLIKYRSKYAMNMDVTYDLKHLESQLTLEMVYVTMQLMQQQVIKMLNVVLLEHSSYTLHHIQIQPT